MTLLSARGITKRYGGVTALDHVDIDIERGHVIGLLGANGSGKSTLSAVLSGETKPSEGELMFDGQPLQSGVPRAARAKGIVIAHQHAGLASDLPVWENVFLGAERCVRGGFVDRRTARAHAARLLEPLRAGWDLDMPAGMLGAADQQLVEIAKAIALDPRMLILDEPTASLAAHEVDALIRTVRSLANAGTAVVFISHRMAEIEALCDSVVVLCNGRRMGQMSVGGVLDERRVLEMMGGVSLDDADRQARERNDDERDPGDESLEAGKRGASNSGWRRREIDRTGPPVLAVDGLRAAHRLAGADLRLHRGEVLGVGGLQGHGQEALLDALAGFLPYDAGQIVLDGARVDAHTPRHMIERGVCLVPNDRHRQGLWLDHSVEFNLAQVHVNFDSKGWRVRGRDVRALAQRAITHLGIKTSGPAEPVRALSGGNQQKIVIGRWLDRALKVLLLSDPTKGVDVMARKQIYAAIHALADRGVSVLVYASDNEELLTTCDRVIVMYEGRVCAELTGESMNEAQLTRASFGRRAA